MYHGGFMATKKNVDRIEGNKIILFDKYGPVSMILKKVEIIKPSGEVRKYEIKKTSKGGYLLN